MFYLSLVKLWAKSAKAFLRNLDFCKNSRFYPIPMGFTTVTHMCIVGPVSWSVLGPNIVWITEKPSFINEQNPFHESNYKTTTRKTFGIRLIHQMVWPVAAPDFFYFFFFFCGGHRGGKMRFWGAKIKKIAKNSILAFFPLTGGEWGKSLRLGAKPPLPLDAATGCGNNHIMLQVKTFLWF